MHGWIILKYHVLNFKIIYDTLIFHAMKTCNFELKVGPQVDSK
jgi:hypothetical protein